jgi:hypothetical protein
MSALSQFIPDGLLCTVIGHKWRAVALVRCLTADRRVVNTPQHVCVRCHAGFPAGYSYEEGNRGGSMN